MTGAADEYPTEGRFRLRIVEVDAFRYLRDRPLPDWFLDYLERWPRRVAALDAGRFDIRGREGWRVLEYGMWVVMRPTGHLSIIEPGDFETAYEPVALEETNEIGEGEP